MRFKIALVAVALAAVSFPVLAAIPQSERDALIALYNATGGPNWTDNTGWLGASGTECTWFGIECSEDGDSVDSIALEENGLSGTLPSELSALTYLGSLSLYENELTGSIPASLGSLSDLWYLGLEDNELSGTIPAALGNLSSLETLWLNGNNLTGTVPSSFANLTSLEYVSLAHNQLSGTFPTSLTQLPNLLYLSLSGNGFTGSIPAEIGNLAMLEGIELDGNQFSGPIPPEIGSLTNLTDISLDGNSIDGQLPAELFNLTSLTDLWLGSNKLSGTIPPEVAGLTSLKYLDVSSNILSGSFPVATTTLPNLLYLDLGGNGLLGTLPSEIGNFASLEYLGLEENQLTGSIPPEVGQLTALSELWLGSNQLSGSIPVELMNLVNLMYLGLEENQLSGQVPSQLSSLTALRELALSDNAGLTIDKAEISTILGSLENLEGLWLRKMSLEGEFPSEIGDMSQLRMLDLGENSLTGSISVVLATLARLPLLEALDLSENQLDGVLPNDLSAFSNLFEFSLWGNQITGQLNSTLGNLTELLYLDLEGNRLSGTIPLEIGNLTKLETLWLSGNDFEGPIPEGIGNLTNLRLLFLDANRLTGSIPLSILDLENLTYLSLWGNRLSGPIPSDIDRLQELEALEIDVNQFSGSIPPAIGNLPNLIELWLSSNLLEGEIPEELWDLTNLELLALNENNLRGVVPRAVLDLENAQYIDMSANALRAADDDVIEFLDDLYEDDDITFEGYQTIPPEDVSVESVSSTSVQLSWTPIGYDWDPGGYQVQVSSTMGGPYTPQVLTSTKWEESAVVSGLQPSTTYYFIVKTVTFPYGGYPYYQLNTVFSESSSEISATTLPASVSEPEVLVTAYPKGLFQAPDVGGSTDSYTLTNVGGAATTITLEQEETFFDQAPGVFTLEPGASQAITLTGKPMPEGEYWGGSIPTGDGVDEDIWVDVFLVSTPVASQDYEINAERNRIDLIAPEGQNPTGKLVFRNTGTGSFTGVAASDVQFLVPQKGLITIPPGGSAEVSVATDRTKRPDASLLSGTQLGRVSLIALEGFAKGRTISNGATGASLVTVADTVKPPTAAGAIPPLGSGEVALYMTSVGHVVGSVGEFVSDISILNSYGTGAADDVKLYYTSTAAGAVTKTASLKALGSNQAVGLADVVKSVFDGDAEVGTMQIRSRQAQTLSATASIFNSSNPAGNYGTSIPVFRSDRSATVGQEIFLTGLRKDASGHTNLYLQETRGSEVGVRLDYISAAGEVIGTANQTVAPFQMLSLINPLSEGAAAVRITTVSGGGALSAYATPVDRASGDTWAVADWNQQYGYGVADSIVIPVGGAVRGANNTYFRTDVTITNRCSTFVPPDKSGGGKGAGDRNPCREATGRGLLRYYPTTGGLHEKDVELGLLQTTNMNDVVRSAFGIESDTVGHFVFIPFSGAFAVTSRTYTTVEGSPATFGSTVPALGISMSIRSGQSRRIGALADSTRSTITAATPATNRTNFGMVETSGFSVQVRVSVFYNDPKSLASGKALGSRVYDLAPNQFVSQSNLVETIIGPQRETLYGDLDGVQVQFDVISQTGAIVVYTSSVDNGTGDSVLRLE